MKNEINNLKKFCKINQKFEKDYHLLFLSSNSGTGKSTYFKFNWCRKALKGKFTFNVFFRYENELDDKFNNDKWLKLPPTASKRQSKLFAKLDITQIKGAETTETFLIEKATGRKLASALCINTQRKVKSTENAILSSRAMFDEIMPDDNAYCPNEVYKFCRLIDTLARNRDFKVLGLYNNVSPFFPYKEYFKDTNAKFIDFVGVKYGQPINKGIQDILAKSNYGEIYNNNNYFYFKEFYKNENVRNKETVFYLSIQDRLFAFKDCTDFYILIPKTKVKKNREVFAVSMENNDYVLIDRQSGLVEILQTALNKRFLFVNNKKFTIYVKELADYLNLSYNL